MRGAHEDDVGSSYLRANYRRGHVVRFHDDWGVVLRNRGNRYHPAPLITWWVDQQWCAPTAVTADGLSAPYIHTYEGIPVEVRAKATYVMLVEDDDE